MRARPSRRWSDYYRAVEGRPPRETLLFALEAFAAEEVPTGRAIDLGAGAGRDTHELLRRGWSVLAIDGAANGLRKLELTAPAQAALELRCLPFEELDELPQARMINASFALPFCRPDAFPQLWSLIKRSLPPGGRFAGQMLGEEDDWAAEPGITAVTLADLRHLFTGFQVEHLVEERKKALPRRGQASSGTSIISCYNAGRDEGAKPHGADQLRHLARPWEICPDRR
ncbi:MAG TPA: class I SAM-dependent methyltransferase [Kiloniellales bacterium]|nr:class I SAM-dependent methyltransferase [Kiloniellales bacterium]